MKTGLKELFFYIFLKRPTEKIIRPDKQEDLPLKKIFTIVENFFPPMSFSEENLRLFVSINLKSF